jgi:class 3 adenylate cyclase
VISCASVFTASPAYPGWAPKRFAGKHAPATGVKLLDVPAVSLPSGTVTLLFSDIEGSTLLVQELGERYGEALATHRRLVRAAVSEAGGHEIDTQGDSFFVAFASARDACGAAVEVQRALGRESWLGGAPLRVRIGVHTGEPAIDDEGYLGLDVHRAARICAAGHGGQILLSQTTRDLVGDAALEGTSLDDLGEHRLKDLPRPERIFQVVAPDLPSSFPPLKDIDRQGRDESPFLGRERELGLEAQTAVAAVKNRLAALAKGHTRRKARGFADLGWEVRSLLPAAPVALRPALSNLGGELFALSRSAVDLDRLLDSVDRKLLTRRLDEYRELGVISARAANEAETLESRLAVLDRLSEARVRRVELGEELEHRIGELRPNPAEAEIEALRARVGEALGKLEETLAEGRELLAAEGVHLKRTMHRGIFRSGNRYVVPFFDEVGIEERREFASLAEARVFRRSLRLEDQPEEEWAEPGITGPRQWGGETGIIKPP